MICLRFLGSPQVSSNLNDETKAKQAIVQELELVCRQLKNSQIEMMAGEFVLEP